MRSAIKFFRDDHTYTLYGTKIPSVTQIISSAGIYSYTNVPDRFLEAASERGRAVHRVLELLALHEGYSPPEWSDGYILAWNKFREFYDVKVIETERIVFHKHHMYCGTLDRICTLRGVDKYIIDIKTTANAMPSHDLQTAAYALAYKSETRQKLKRASVYLHDCGKFQFVEYQEKGQESIFLAALQIYNWKVRNGIEK